MQLKLYRKREKPQNPIVGIEKEDIVPFCKSAFIELKSILKSQTQNLPDDVHFHTCLVETTKNGIYTCAFVITTMYKDQYARICHKNGYPETKTTWTLSFRLAYSKVSKFGKKPYIGCYLYDPNYKATFTATLNMYLHAIHKAGVEAFACELDYEPSQDIYGPVE